jgi:Cytochrome P460
MKRLSVFTWADLSIATLALLASASCSGGNTAGNTGPSAATVGTNAPASGNESKFGPLEVGADYLAYQKMTEAPFKSTVHGGRWVDVYVTQNAADVYVKGGDMPVGSVVVKTSVEDEGGQPGTFAGPIFIMEKRAPGYDPAHGDWYYAIQWAKPTAAIAKQTGGPFYWRGKSKSVAYCYECHENYDRSLGGLTPSSLLMR